MQVEIPARIQARVGPSTTAQLVAGTYSMTGALAEKVAVPKPRTRLGETQTPQQRQQQYRDVAKNVMQFRAADGSFGEVGSQIPVGTLDPSRVVPGNQIVLLVVTPSAVQNTVQELARWGLGKSEAGRYVVGCWVPDGAAGRFMVEQEKHHIRKWFGAGAGPAMNDVLRKVGVTIVAIVAAFYSCVFPFGWLVPHIGMWAMLITPIMFFTFQKVKRLAARLGIILHDDEEVILVQDWAMQLMTQGKFQEEFAHAFPAGLPSGADGGNDNSLL